MPRSRNHQRIVQNIIGLLWTRQRDTGAPWEAIPDFGVRISEKNRPEPDVTVVSAAGGNQDHHTDHVVVAFDVLPPTSTSAGSGKRMRGCRR